MAVVRAFESVYLSEMVTLSPPSLDLGCGDGKFAASVFGKVDVGIDISAKEVRRARRSGTFTLVHCTDGHTIPYPDEYFKTIMSNCVIEHIAYPEGFVREIARVLNGGGVFIFTTWTPEFNRSLLVRRNWYVRWKSNFLAHRSIKSVDEWTTILLQHNMAVTDVKHYLPASSIKLLDSLELLSLIGIWKFNLFNLYRLTAPFLANFVIIKMARVLEAYMDKWNADGTGCGVIIKATKKAGLKLVPILSGR